MKARRIPLSHAAQVTGWHPVTPGHGMVAFESGLERDCIGFLARQLGFLRIISQPISIVLTFEGRARRYTPDFLVVFDAVPAALEALGFLEETYVEVKYADQVGAERALIAARLENLSVWTGRPAVVLDERIIRGGAS